MLKKDFFTRDPLACAAEMIGCELRWDHCSGIVVETEAYAEIGDEACHTFLRRGAQRFVDKHPAGTAYIYLNYGMHWLLNVLIKGETNGFVLIRALEPRAGQALMAQRRGMTDAARLCSGPGKLTQALGVPPAFHGSSLCHDPCRSFHGRSPEEPAVAVVADVRIGISRAADLPWRFLASGSRYVSRGLTRRPTAANPIGIASAPGVSPKKSGPSRRKDPTL